MKEPNYVVTPGDYLQEWAEEEGVEHDVLALRLGMSRELVDRILAGVEPVTREIAAKLEGGTGIPALAWRRYEQAYRPLHWVTQCTLGTPTTTIECTCPLYTADGKVRCESSGAE